MVINNRHKKQLRSIGHKLKPVVIVAGNGLTDTVLEEIQRALNDHELIKVKLAIVDRQQRQHPKGPTPHRVQQLGRSRAVLEWERGQIE